MITYNSEKRKLGDHVPFTFMINFWIVAIKATLYFSSYAKY